MVVRAVLSEERADRIFHALADATRRDVVRRVLRAETSVSAVARHYAMSVTAVQKHVGVLERAGLVRKTRRGREQIVSAEVDPLRLASRLLDQLEALWRGRVARMADLLADEGAHGARTPRRATTR